MHGTPVVFYILFYLLTVGQTAEILAAEQLSGSELKHSYTC